MRWLLIRPLEILEASAHPKMQHETRLVVQRDAEILAVTLGTRERAPFQSILQLVLGYPFQDDSPIHADRLDLLVKRGCVHVLLQGLHIGQFRHTSLPRPHRFAKAESQRRAGPCDRPAARRSTAVQNRGAADGVGVQQRRSRDGDTAQAQARTYDLRLSSREATVKLSAARGRRCRLARRRRRRYNRPRRRRGFKLEDSLPYTWLTAVATHAIRGVCP